MKAMSTASSRWVVVPERHPAGRDVADDRDQRSQGEQHHRTFCGRAEEPRHRVGQAEDLQEIADRVGTRKRAVEEVLAASGNRRPEDENPDHAGPAEPDCRDVDREPEFARPRLGPLRKPEEADQEQHVEGEIEGVDRRGKRYGSRCRLVRERRSEDPRQRHVRSGHPAPGRGGPGIATAPGCPPGEPDGRDSRQASGRCRWRSDGKRRQPGIRAAR